MKRETTSFALRLNAWFAAVVVALSVALFLAAYLLLYRAIQEKEREVVRAQLEVYRVWYAEGGLDALSKRFARQQESDKETFIVRVVGADGSALFASMPPRADFDLSKLEGMTHCRLAIGTRRGSSWPLNCRVGRCCRWAKRRRRWARC
jgi:hypothetical protein